MTNDNSHLQAAFDAGLIRPVFNLERESLARQVAAQAELKQATTQVESRMAAQVFAVELYSLRDENNVKTGFTGWRMKVGTSVMPMDEAFPLKLVVTVTGGNTGTGMLEGSVQTVYAGTATFEELEAEWGTQKLAQWLADFHERDIDVIKVATNIKADIPAGCFLALADSALPYELVMAR